MKQEKETVKCDVLHNGDMFVRRELSHFIILACTSGKLIGILKARCLLH